MMNVESNPKKLRDQARTLGIDPKGIKIMDLRKVVAAKLNEESEPAPKKGKATKGKAKAPKKAAKGGKKPAPVEAEAEAEDTEPQREAAPKKTAKKSTSSAIAKQLEEAIERTAARLVSIEERLDKLEEDSKRYSNVVAGGPYYDSTGEFFVVPEKYAELLADMTAPNEEGEQLLDYDFDADECSIEQLDAVMDIIGMRYPEGTQGLRAKRQFYQRVIDSWNTTTIEAQAPIAGPEGQNAYIKDPANLAEGDDVWIADVENNWFRAKAIPTEEEGGKILCDDEDGDVYFSALCEDGETALVYFLPEGEADPRYVGHTNA